MPLVATLGCAAALAACSSSTSAPSDPLVGAWRVSFDSVPAGTAIAPSPWTLSVAKSGAVYTASYSDLSWSFTSNSAVIDTWTGASDSSTFEIKGDSLLLLAHDNGFPKCYLGLAGTISGGAAQGRVVAFASDLSNTCLSGFWKWSATKQ